MSPKKRAAGEEQQPDAEEATKSPKKSPAKKAKKEPAAKSPAAAKTAAAAATTTTKGKKETEEKSSPAAPKKKKAKKPAPDPVTERDPTPRVHFQAGEGGRLVKILSWNVDGLRAEGRTEDLRALIEAEDPDALCLQETKLPVDAPWEGWSAVLGDKYHGFWSMSRAKKGYAGTAIFTRRSAGLPADGMTFGDGITTPAGSDAGGGGGGAAAGSGGDAKKPAAAKAGKGSIANFFAKKTAAPSAAASSSSSSSGSATDSSAGDGGSGAGGPMAVRSVTFGIGDKKHDEEGRSITVEFGSFFVVNLYVPNSGQKLERLEYRLKSWNPDLQRFVATLEAEGVAQGVAGGGGKPVVVLGDLNVAHRDVDIYNYFAPHLKKTAGCTAEERAAHTAWLAGNDGSSTTTGDDCGGGDNAGAGNDESEGGGGGGGGGTAAAASYVDAFRHVHGDVRGAYTYWSMRSGGRPENKGLRLDYFICSASMASSSSSPSAPSSASSQALSILDSYCLPEVTVKSDHAAVALALKLAA